ncbi:vacuolar protein sorting-associated protein [Anaeramoeba flamelloides]|uniref:Vacuolar protein sorting-associated protein n=1 Tax=Anaeramoeba flamelloides TaxID=1746091 RepID=A0ABQ8XLV9_9EUKA|nr:vacuolar protein sorting-associated protein [Anaeramoeba flamelloides]
MSSFFSSKGVCTIGVELTNVQDRSIKVVKRNKKKKNLYVYSSKDTISGVVEIRATKKRKKLEHIGIELKLCGVLESSLDSSANIDLVSSVKKLATAGTLSDRKWQFSFPEFNMPQESYDGINTSIRYYVKVTIKRNYAVNIKQEKEFCVMNLDTKIPKSVPIKMEVGIEDFLHIDFTFPKSAYHLNDVILGRINYYLAKINLKHMQIAIVKREIFRASEETFTEKQTMCTFEVMDGAPVKGESIPVRFFLENLKISPTYRKIAKRFSVRYYLTLFLIDEREKRYFKQNEIIFYRKSIPKIEDK